MLRRFWCEEKAQKNVAENLKELEAFKANGVVVEGRPVTAWLGL